MKTAWVLTAILLFVGCGVAKEAVKVDAPTDVMIGFKPAEMDFAIDLSRKNSDDIEIITQDMGQLRDNVKGLLAKIETATTAVQEIQSTVTAEKSNQFFTNFSGGAVWAFLSLAAVLGTIIFLVWQRKKLWKGTSLSLAAGVKGASEATQDEIKNYVKECMATENRKAFDKAMDKEGLKI
jgi:cell division septum initiation protein DivIVA